MEEEEEEEEEDEEKEDEEEENYDDDDHDDDDVKVLSTIEFFILNFSFRYIFIPKKYIYATQAILSTLYQTENATVKYNERGTYEILIFI